MISDRNMAILRLSALHCILMLSCACFRVHDVSSFITVHEDMRLTENGRADNLLTVDEMIESGTNFTGEKLSLRPKIGDYEITVQFVSRPSLDRRSQYQELDEHGLQNSFFVFRGPPPLKPVVLESRYAEIGALDTPTNMQSRTREYRREGDELQEIVSISYVIGWNEYRLEGRAHIVRSSHEEADYLLD
jgi:hypothetical protein